MGVQFTSATEKPGEYSFRFRFRKYNKIEKRSSSFYTIDERLTWTHSRSFFFKCFDQVA
jgi:hypothetical protein